MDERLMLLTARYVNINGAHLIWAASEQYLLALSQF